jgi:hypothetical protein
MPWSARLISAPARGFAPLTLTLYNILTWHDILTFPDDTVNKMG